MKTVSFIIPVYNEEKRLVKTFKALEELQLPDGFELQQIYFVNDGSKDSTLQKLNSFQESHPALPVSILSYAKNKGKGYAVKVGMQVARTDYTLFFDADMSTPLDQLAKFVPYIEQGIDVIVGTRKNGQSTVIKHQPFIREFLGKGFTITTQLAFGIVATDFTCGFKAFSQKARESIFAKAFVNRWSYDVEILVLAKKHKHLMQEVAVLWSNDERSRVNLFKDIPLTLLELASIYWMYIVVPALISIYIAPFQSMIQKLPSLPRVKWTMPRAPLAKLSKFLPI